MDVVKDVWGRVLKSKYYVFTFLVIAALAIGFYQVHQLKESKGSSEVPEKSAVVAQRLADVKEAQRPEHEAVVSDSEINTDTSSRLLIEEAGFKVVAVSPNQKTAIIHGNGAAMHVLRVGDVLDEYGLTIRAVKDEKVVFEDVASNELIWLMKVDSDRPSPITRITRNIAAENKDISTQNISTVEGGFQK